MAWNSSKWFHTCQAGIKSSVERKPRVADLELSLPCKTQASRAGLVFMWTFWPVWALLAPITILATVIAISVYPVVFNPAVSAALIGGSFAIFLAGIVLTAMLEDDKVFLTADGISFPLSMLALVNFRRHRNWSDVAEADISGENQTLEAQRLVLKFKSGGAAAIPFAAFSPTDLEQLLLAIELWGKDSQRSHQLIEYQRQLQNTSKGASAVNYTQLWEEELGRRFSGTTFVPLEPGTKIRGGTMVVQQQLGFGGWSAVYLVELADRQKAVLKESVLPAGLDAAITAKAQEHFAREAKLLQRLSHPNICRVHDHFVDAGRNYLLLEYVEGANLRQHVRQFGLPAATSVAHWGSQLAEILTHLHSFEPPIVHRDISPDNLMLRPDGSIMLIDFGAANEICGNATGTMVGKQAYMSPEQVRGRASAASDIYAFGCTLHFLLTGSDPAPLSVSEPTKTRPDIPADLNAIVAACTQFELEARPTNLKELEPRLAALSQDQAGGAA